MKRWFKKAIVWVLQWEARAVLHTYKPHIVAITGSVGKTSAKDAIYAVLAQKYHVRKSEKSFNSELGVPLTVLGVPNAWGNPVRWLQNIFDGVLLLLFSARYPEWLVLEVGADRPGDIRSLAGWLPLDVAVITRLPEVPVHVEFFNSAEEVVEEKASLIDAIKPGGTLILYADDERTRALQNRLPAPDAKILLFGFAKDADVRGEEFKLLVEGGREHWPTGMSGAVVVDGASAPLSISGAVGPHAFLPTLAGAAVGHALGMRLPETVEGLENYDPPPGRMRLVPGVKGTLVIDDTYNASPAATLAALDTLESIRCSGRKIFAIGDMLELGRHSVEEHRKVGERAAKVADVLITVGFRARDIASAALDNGLPDAQILQYEDSRVAGRELQNMLKEGDCVLAKGSQSMRMERLVEEIMLEPGRAEDLLVRQDTEWKKR